MGKTMINNRFRHYRKAQHSNILKALSKKGINLVIQKKSNLIAFADYLDSLPKETAFTLDRFNEGSFLDYALKLFPSKPDEMEEGYLDIGCYIQRVFVGLGWTPIYDYLFTADWISIDDTLKGFTKRIRFVCKNGLPETFDRELYEGYPLSYKPQIFNPFTNNFF